MSKGKPTHFHMMAKPVSYRCNLKCDYCFYLEKEDTIHTPNSGNQDLMSDSVLKRYVRDYIESQDADVIDFAWQGGEPTLAGLDFFKKVVQFQKQFANGKTIHNSFQTNAIGINRQWAEFFAENRFLIGVSVDGTADIHDKYRVSVNGKPTFQRVKQAIDLLKEYNVEFNTLTVINDENWDKGKEVYHALKDLGSQFLQFIPIVEIRPECNKGVQSYSPVENAELAPFSVPAEGYGKFMIDVFNEWVLNDVGKVYVRMFDSILACWMGHSASVCVQAKNCGQAMIIEANGDMYSCDHYVYDDNRLGNMMQTNIKQLALSKQQRNFGLDKSRTLTSQCLNCNVQELCYGGCPKHRINVIEGEHHRQNYLCPSYKAIFTHTAPAMHHMSEAIRRGGLAADVMPMMAQFYNR
ncbi:MULTISPECIES: anaerobic sulfatase maturase [Vibrio]|uniref:Anaerobic sulfatase maturase n=1 Tax=Vibrio navarrensis TaxID=29495 RepID=A0AAJ4LXN5_9VIBR|nr:MULTISPECIES: anaerobic sulfatase maturase [Vibrio]KJR38599.1 sulfatase [Vibrio sp. S234-5]MBE3662888.1 anaerobic sulfatase maturase [Vibrio navarrensis]MBE3671083.1 anaerobic sulfatase maturase [Vibrio navarrensis]MBE4594450.1 anaerobic sulfatase maturase [Vibrio navarrensis]QPL56589.1 anaerobic sulfatase maturase [Vibrio navarrensis]